MENQHRKIKGYRELSQQEIDLMNRIKAKEGELLALQAEVVSIVNEQAQCRGLSGDAAIAERDRLKAAEPMRWAAIAKTDIQTGIMALVRAIAQPSSC